MHSSSSRRKKHLITLEMEALLEMGGFFQDETENIMCENYSSRTIDVVQKYVNIGPGFIYVADEVEKQQMVLHESTFEMLCEYGMEYSDGFEDWYLEQTAKYAMRKYLEQKGNVWMSWEMDRKIKSILGKMTAFEEELLLLYFGLTDGNPQTEEAIAANEEFLCDPNYIFLVIERILNKLEENKVSRETLELLCEQRKSKQSFNAQ